jgi:hypothetical protein
MGEITRGEFPMVGDAFPSRDVDAKSPSAIMTLWADGLLSRFVTLGLLCLVLPDTSIRPLQINTKTAEHGRAT